MSPELTEMTKTIFEVLLAQYAVFVFVTFVYALLFGIERDDS